VTNHFVIDPTEYRLPVHLEHFGDLAEGKSFIEQLRRVLDLFV
jgi:hypothetical protein